MINSRNIIRFQWVVIAVLVLMYWFKTTPCPPCAEVAPSRTVYIAYHDSTPRTDTVAPKKTGVREKIKNPLVAPRPLYAQDTVPVADSCDNYLATAGDSMVDIQVSYCSSAPVQDFSITYRHFGVKQVTIIDSIPYPVGFRRALYAGVCMNTGGGVGPAFSMYNPKTTYSYSYDLLLRQHHLGVGWRLWGR